jgi:hypothetical protein
MIKPLPIFLYVLVVAATAGCSGRHATETIGSEDHHQDAPRSGAPHGLATPVSALGIRG